MHRNDWLALTRNAVPPPDLDPDVLTRDLLTFLASPDPELRDTVAYTLLATWIQAGRFTPGQQRDLLDVARARLHVGLGEQDTDSVFIRSFAALLLASLIERDLRAPFLLPTDRRQALDDCLTLLVGERDLRGYDQQRGWAHTTAHTADALGALAQQPDLTSDDLGRVLRTMFERLVLSDHLFLFWEPSRLALAAMVCLTRLDDDEVTAWSDRIANWITRNAHGSFTPDLAARRANVEAFLASLALHLEDRASSRVTRDRIRGLLEQSFFIVRTGS